MEKVKVRKGKIAYRIGKTDTNTQHEAAYNKHAKSTVF